jgi:hypothetical protein
VTTVLQDSVQAALANAYTLERELSYSPKSARSLGV